MVICLVQGADLHMAQLMPLPLTVLASVKSRLVPAHLGSAGQRAVERVYCVDPTNACVGQKDDKSQVPLV